MQTITNKTIQASGYRKSFIARISFLWLLLTALTPLTLSSVHAQTYPSGFSQVQVASGIKSPTVMAFAPDGRIFLAEQAGNLRVIKNGTLLSTPFLQLNVNSTGERGIIGIALDPNFATNRYIYLYHTLPDASRNRISRFTANGDVVLAGSEKIILNLDPLSSAVNHNGGAMHFGKDGKLYIAVGDNAYPNNAQNLDTYHGKLLRINPDGSIPSGNPFTSGTEQKKRIWAYGLRNPYTFDIQPGTGKIYVNDVGQDSWEEINDATTGGRNFGWPHAEGNSTNTAYTNPVYTYSQGLGDGKGCAITGGVFFNPTQTNYPAQYVGRYFYMDWCNLWINMLSFSNGVSRLPFATSIPRYPVVIDVGTDGNLYFLSRSAGSLYKIIYTNTTAPVITSHPKSVTVSEGQSASFTVSAAGTTPLKFQWQKNGVNITGATSATYTVSGTTSAHTGQYRVLVSNAYGSATSNSASLTVTGFNAAPVPTITTPASGTLYSGGQTIQFSGDATDKEDGALSANAFTWSVVFHHDTHTHAGPPVATGVKSGSFVVPSSGETSANVWYRIYLTVKDSKGLETSVYRDIHARTSMLNFATNPTGLKVTLDGQPVTAPASVKSVEGIVRSIGVVSPQTVGGISYTFHSWQHGGTASQTITTPVTDITYTAVYKPILRNPDNPTSTVNGLSYAYYEGTWSALPNFSALTPVKKGTVSTFSLSPRNRNDYFGFQFDGYVQVPTDGIYTFYTSSDDGSRLYIGDQLVIDNNGLHSAQERSGRVALKMGKHAIKVNYFDRAGGEALTVSYAGPGITKQVIPASVLYRSTSTFTPLHLEAENAFISGARKATNYSGYTGTGYVDYVNPSGDYIEWSVNVPSAGSYTLAFRYALGSGNRPLEIKVNGSTVASGLTFPATNSWSTWGTVNTTASLNAGLNKVRATAVGSSGANLDHLKVSAGSAAKEMADATINLETIEVFPNPANDYITISFPSAEADQKIQVRVMDVLSKTWKVLDLTVAEGGNAIPIFVGDLSSGTYLVQVSIGENKKVVKRIVVSR